MGGNRVSDLDAVRELPDLAVRWLGGSVVDADDEFFAERENLIRPEPPTFRPGTFGAKGQVYDGWETRRRRQPGPGDADRAIVRLGVPGVVRAVVVDTAHFLGNYPPEVSVEGTCLPGHPSVADLLATPWRPLVDRSPVKGNAENVFPVRGDLRCTHVRLSIYPDGGVARLRVHGEVVADADVLAALDTFDLAALEHGGRVESCSNRFYGAPDRLIAPGLARSMGEGWETARRRDDGNDWALVRLATQGVVRLAELDTSWFVGNAPGWAALTAYDGEPSPDAPGTPLLERTRLQPDTRHRFVLPAAPAATHVRLDVFPDGGMARLRLWGRPTAGGSAALRDRWAATAPGPGGAA